MDNIWYFHAGVSLWVAMREGLDAAKKSAIDKRLSEKFKYVKNSSEYLEILIKNFSHDYEDEVLNLVREMKTYRQLHHQKDELLKFARLSAINVENLTRGEEDALGEVQNALESTLESTV